MTTFPESNSAMLLTAPGSGAIAVVRLVGPATEAFLAEHFSGVVRPGRCVHGVLRAVRAGAILDDPVVTRPGPNIAELNLHGSAWIVHQVLELARGAGFSVDTSPALPLPAEAVDPWPGSGEAEGGNLSQAVLRYLPLARTELAVRALLAQPKAWDGWWRLEADRRRQEAGTMLEDRALWWLLHPPHVAIVGPPNAGKSTLANQLFAQERSIVADQPGTTRDWVGELANINDLAVMLVDTPGQRLTEDPIEREAIEQSGEVIRSADLIVHLLDASRPLEDSIRTTSAPVIRVANKQDQRTWEAEALGAMPLTATTGEGLEALRQAIVRQFGCERLELDRPRWWTPEHYAWLTALAAGQSVPETPPAIPDRR